MIKVILRDTVSGLGRRGEILEVANGYARNYLLPKGLAMASSEGAASQAEVMRKASEQRDARDRSAAEEIATTLVPATIAISANAGPEGRLFGSVSTEDISRAVREQTGIDLEPTTLLLDEPIKELGLHSVMAKLHSDVQFPVSIDVSALE